MSDRDLHDLLTRVASGELDPAEASRLLDDSNDSPRGDRAPGAIAAVRITASAARIAVVADPTIAAAVADGPHVAREENGSLVIDVPGVSDDGYRLDGRTMLFGRIPLGWGGGSWPSVTVRVNPSLPLTVDAAACETRVSGHRSSLDVTCSSGKLVVQDLRGPLRGAVTAGSASVEAALGAGEHRFSCDLGSLSLVLLPGSDVQVDAHVEMGSLKVVGDTDVSSGPRDLTGLHETRSLRVATAAGRLDLGARMASVTVVLP